MKPIVLFDVNVGSENMGDAIIMHYCNLQLRSIFPNEFFLSIPTHDYIGERFKRIYADADIKIVCGTNLISSTMDNEEYMQWFFDSKDKRNLRDVILMGVGWQAYNDEVNRYSKKLLLNILSKEKYLLSVRDDYTKSKLNSIGFHNVINTGCPTMWSLTREFCEQVNSNKKEVVITTITNYRRDYEADKYMLQLLRRKYKKVYIWIQSYYDVEYLKEICDLNEYELIPPVLEQYTNILKIGVDYVGTRLHAGIHAINNKCRSIIIAVDNRAIEISKDTNLFIIRREDVYDKLESVIDSKILCEINMPIEQIAIWKEQFI